MPLYLDYSIDNTLDPILDRIESIVDEQLDLTIMRTIDKELYAKIRIADPVTLRVAQRP